MPLTEQEIKNIVENYADEIVKKTTRKPLEEETIKSMERSLKLWTPILTNNLKRFDIVSELTRDPDLRKKVFGRELSDEEKEYLRKAFWFFYEEQERGLNQVAQYYSVSQAMKEFGLKLHFPSLKTLCLVCGTPKAEMEKCPKCNIVTGVFTR